MGNLWSTTMNILRKRIKARLKRALFGSKPAPPEMTLRPEPPPPPAWMAQELPLETHHHSHSHGHDHHHAHKPAVEKEAPPAENIFAEKTANPSTYKFILTEQKLSAFSASIQDIPKKEHRLMPLLQIEGVTSFFCANNYVVTTRSAENDWEDLIPLILAILRTLPIEKSDP
jgi:hypothetical protein